MGNIGAWKILHNSPHASTKGGRNKCGRHTITYVPGADNKKIA